ncbi:MAG: hypothetical protein ACK4MF_04560 [Hyphomicrobiaceae bacterium]
MAFTRGASASNTSSNGSAEGRGIDLGDGDWIDEERPARDWKKAVLVIGLGVLSWVATYIGMLELIEANMGALPLVHKLVIGFSVAMLMTMIVWLLDQIFAPIGFMTRVTFIAGYIFLTVISVGFGFGFYWKVLESRSESGRSAEAAVSQVQGSLHAASTRMTQLSATLDQLNQISLAKAELERSKGTSCPNSRPGDGPRRKLRDDDAQRFGFAAEFVKSRVATVNAELAALDGDLVKIASDDKSIVDVTSGTRNEFMKSLGRKLDMTVTGFNAFRTDPQLKQIRADLAERADKTVFPDTQKGTFSCPDAQLQQALKGVVRAIDQLPVLEKPKIAAVEGSEATIEAFRRLIASFYGLLSFKMPPSADELRELQTKAVQSVEAAPANAQKALSGDVVVGLSKRDYIPLAIALFVDLCLLLVSMSRPMNRLHSLVPKMRAAERGPVIQILARFNDIHHDAEIRKNFEVFRHVVFDFHGAYYVAVPLDAPYKPGGPYTKSTSTEDIESLQQEAHLLANLFTSFEQEKIFSRIYSPLLTTRTIQKKLARQGSKFAHADAFRIYRFRDGAWSEIILGAVMGAARRVEAEKRRRRLEEQLFNPNAATAPPSLEAANDQTRTAAAAFVPPQEDVRSADVAADLGLTGTDSARPAAAHRSAGAHLDAARVKVDPATVDEFGPYALRRARELVDEAYRETLPTLRGQDGALDRPRRRASATRFTARTRDGDATPSGEVVLFAIPGSEAPRDRGVDARPARSPVLAAYDRDIVLERPSRRPPAPQPAATGSDAVMPAPDGTGEPCNDTEPRIGVRLTRETAEFTVPAGEASLPPAFRAAVAPASAAAAPASVPAPVPPPLPVTAAIGGAQANPAEPSDVADTSAISDTDEDAGDDDQIFNEPEIDIAIDAISKRFRPTPAE